MNFKKVFGITLCVALVCVGFTGCKKKDNSSSETTAAQTTAETKSQAYEKGKINDKEYVNESLGMKFTLPEGYTFMTEEQLGASVDAGSDLMLGEGQDSLKNAAKSSVSAYEMAAINTKGENVNMLVQESGVEISGETYLGMIKQQLESMDLNVTFKDDEKINLAGIEFDAVAYDIEIGGIKQQQKQLFKSVDKKSVIITFTYTSEEGIKKMTEAFTAL